MKLITEQWLNEKNACLTSKDTAIKNNWIGLNIFQSLDLLIYANRLNDANWLIAQYMKKKQNVLYAIFAAEQVIHIFEKKCPNEDRPRKAIKAAKNYLKNPCKKTKDSAYDAAYAAAAYDAAAYAAYAAYAADDADAAHAAANAANAANAYANAANAAYANANLKLKIIQNGINILKNKGK